MNDDDQNVSRSEECRPSGELSADNGGEGPLKDSEIGRATRGQELIRKLSPRDEAKSWDDLARMMEVGVEGPSNSERNEPLAARYDLLEMLGRGGFATVVLAYDRQLGRNVAIKIPRPDILFCERMQRRFLTEAKSVAELNHPGILPVLDVGADGPLWYMVLARCGGPSLEDWLREQPTAVPPTTAAWIVAQVAAAAHYAHYRGILHRDIKPANILLEPTDWTSCPGFAFTPKLTDFGLAKDLTRDGGLTQESAVLGTPHYMAPEQAAAEHCNVGVGTDVYALGVVLYELLTGKPPFAELQGADWCVAVRDSTPPAIRATRPDVPRDLEAICQKCLEKRPGDRYDSAEALRADLQRFLVGEPVLARPISTARHVARWCRRRPLVASLVAMLMVAVACGVAGIAWQWRRAEQNLAESRASLERSHKLLLLLGWAVDESYLWSASNFQADPEFKTLLANEFRAFLSHERSPDTSPTLIAMARRRVAQELWRREDQKAGAEGMLKSVQAWRAIVQANPEIRLHRRLLALTFADYFAYRTWLSDPKWTVELLLRGDLVPGLSLSNPTDRATVMDLSHEVGSFAGALRKSKTSGAREHFEAAAMMLNAVGTADPKLFPSCQERLAPIYRLLGSMWDAERRYEDAERAFMESLHAYEALAQRPGSAQEYRLEIIEVNQSISVARKRAGNLASAAMAMEATIQHCLTMAADEPANVFPLRVAADLSHDLAILDLSNRSTEDQLALWQRAAELMSRRRSKERIATRDLRELTESHRRVAELALSLGRRELAKESYVKGIACCEGLIDPAGIRGEWIIYSGLLAKLADMQRDDGQAAEEKETLKKLVHAYKRLEVQGRMHRSIPGLLQKAEARLAAD